MENDWAEKLQMIDSEEKISEIEIKTENHEKSETKCIEIHYESSKQEPTPEYLSEIEEDVRNEETAEIDAKNYSDYELPQPHFQNYESFGETCASNENFMKTNLLKSERFFLRSWRRLTCSFSRCSSSSKYQILNCRIRSLRRAVLFSLLLGFELNVVIYKLKNH